MTNLTLRHTVVGIVAGVLLAAPAVWAQQPQAPASGAHDSPRPDELEPGVNTSAVPPPSQPAPAAAASASGSDSTSGPASAKTPPASDGSSAGVSKAPGRAKAAAGTAGTAGEGQQDKKANIDGQQDKKANAARGGKAEDHLQLDTTDITGNQELPKVLYIVPWKRSDLGDLLGKPANSLLDEVLEPVDRDVFKRENRYYDAVKPDAAAAAPGAGQNSGEKR